jgi:zinc/manganese transport system substrate-binding protein
MRHLIIAGLVAFALSSAGATIRVVTSLPDLAEFVQHVGGEKVTVDFIVRGNQNPHFIEIKPSYMMKLKSADLFFVVGMDLEIWAPQIIDGSRNASLTVVDLSKNIQKLEVPGKVDASMGDVHRFGNPHYWLDPRNVRIMVRDIASALSAVSPADEQIFHANAEAYLKLLDVSTREWEQTMRPFAGAKIVTFHTSWSYFAQWLNLTVAGQVEPKPGIQPTPGHTAELLQLVRSSGIKAIVVEPFYDPSAAEQIARSGGSKVIRLATSSGGVEEAKSYIGLMSYNVRTLSEALR